MLWHKSWIEVRFRFALTFVLAFYSLYMILSVLPGQIQVKFPNLTAAELGVKIWNIFVLGFGGLMLPISAKVLAGAGINAQTSMGMSRGFHGSMSFLLSMPVSRRQILTTRAAIGAILMLILALFVFAVLQSLAPFCNIDFSKVGLWQALPNIFLVSLFFYCLAVWLTTFLDEFWSGTIGLLILGAFAGYGFSLPGTWLDMFSYMTNPAALMPLGQTICIVITSASLLYAAQWVVDRKEY